MTLVEQARGVRAAQHRHGGRRHRGRDAKFLYRFWRPTAIPLADTDDNPNTVADQHGCPCWRRPEPSGVSVRSRRPERCGGPGARPHLRRSQHVRAPDRHGPLLLREHITASRRRPTRPTTRACTADGIHFRTAVRDGRIIGDNVGRLVVRELLQPLYHDERDHRRRDD